MYWYMYRTCIGRDPTVQYLKKVIEITFSESHILPSSPDLRPVFYPIVIPHSRSSRCMRIEMVG